MADVGKGAETKAEDGRAKRDRSPSFPFIPLKAAIERLSAFDVYFKRHPAPIDKAGLAWNMKGKSSQALQTVAALKAFGLLESQRSGGARHIVISEDGRTYLRAEQDHIKREVLRRTALRPKQIANRWGEWGADRPPDPVCLDRLRLEDGFTDAAAKLFLQVYDETIAFAKLSDSDKSEPGCGAESEAADEGEGAVMQPASKTAHVSGQPMVSLPIGRPRIVMNGDHLDIQASVDLEGLKQLQTMLQKYAEILAMMAPKKEDTAN